MHTPEDNCIDLPNLDAPIYRVFNVGREQRGSTVFSYGWKHVVEPGELAHQEPVDTTTADTRHRAHVGASYYLEGLCFDWHDSDVRVVGKVDGFPSQLFFHHLSHFGRCANRDDFQLSVQRWKSDSPSVRISCQQVFRPTSIQLETYSSPSSIIRPFSRNCR